MSDKYYCKGPKHHPADPEKGIESTMVETSFEKIWCSVECEQAYFGRSKDEKEERFQKFIDRGRIIEQNKKRAAELEAAA